LSSFVALKKKIDDKTSLNALLKMDGIGFMQGVTQIALDTMTFLPPIKQSESLTRSHVASIDNRPRKVDHYPAPENDNLGINLEQSDS